MHFSKKDLQELENKTAAIVVDAGNQVLESWHDIKQISYKDKRDIASNTDIEVENEIREKLTRILPEAGFIVEEGITQKNTRYNWAIDPIDGTKNYINKLPLFLTQIALLENDEPILAHVYNPVSKQLFSASLGNGASLNKTKLNLISRKDAEEAIVDIDFGGLTADIDWKISIFSKLAKKFYRVRISGGFLSIYVAAGAIDSYISINKENKLVDIYPRIIILKEAGMQAQLVDLGDDNEAYIFSNPHLLPKIVKILKEA